MKDIKLIDSHDEEIICPECKSKETASVEHSWPWWSYVHECQCCNYIIMESEWNKVTSNKQ